MLGGRTSFQCVGYECLVPSVPNAVLSAVKPPLCARCSAPNTPDNSEGASESVSEPAMSGRVSGIEPGRQDVEKEWPPWLAVFRLDESPYSSEPSVWSFPEDVAGCDRSVSHSSETGDARKAGGLSKGKVRIS